MSEPAWPRIWELFEAALERPPEGRDLWLDDVCQGDAELRGELARLLAAHERTSTLLDREGAAGALGAVAEDGRVALADARVGPYRPTRQLGEGGMGVVYEAEQDFPLRRRVALKLIRQGMASTGILERFDAERRALALMDHPDIARVLDAGATATGRPYFAMELVDGERVDRWADRERLTVRQRVELFAPLCRAVHHAHQKGIVHRDLKPSNLLVAIVDGRPRIKVIDFGVARAVAGEASAEERLTAGSELVGTLDYMSPEQIDPALDVDTRSDIYALGVVLYELLTGTLPHPIDAHRGSGTVGLLRRLEGTAARTPSAVIRDLGAKATEIAAARRSEPRGLARELRGDLDRIVARAIAHDRAERYAAASDLAVDLERFLRHEPVAAATAGGLYRARKFVRRHRWSVAAASLFAALMVAFAVSSMVQARRVRAALGESRAQTARAESVAAFLARLFRSSDPKVALGADTPVREILDRGAREIAADRDIELRTRAALLLTLAEVYGNLGEPARAEALARESLELRRSGLGADHPDTLAALNDLGVWVRKQERFDEARALLEEAHERRRRVLGEGHADTLATAQNLATMLLGEGRQEEAIALLRTLLARQTETFGEEHDATMTTVNILAIALQRQGQHDEAEPLVRRALDYRRRTLGADDPSTLTSWSNLGVVLKAAGREREAATEFRGALEARRRVLGPDHASTLTTAQNLAATLSDLGELEEAESTLRPTLEAFHRTLGPDHSLSLICGHNLARVLVRSDRSGEAERIYRDLLERAGRSLPASHSYHGLFRSGLGASLAGLGHTDEARAMLAEAVALLEKTVGADHVQAREARERLAALEATSAAPPTR